VKREESKNSVFSVHENQCPEKTRGVALPFTLKNILRQKKNYGNSNISPCKNIIFKKSSKMKPKSFKIL
jgi:hypothetical protein